MAVPVADGRIREIGHALFARVRARQPWRFGRAWLDDAAMAWTMRDERLKAQLFRFVDALPGLPDDAELNRHLVEYLGPVADRLPAPARWALGRLDGPLGLVAPPAARFAAGQLARKFIVGSTLPEALRTIGRLRRRGLAFTIDLLGEAILSEAEADRYRDQYLALIAGLCDEAGAWRADPRIDGAVADPQPRVNVSIKLSALSSRWDPMDPEGSSREVRARLRPVLRLARARGAFVNVDMESAAYKDLTLRILRDALDEEEFRDWRQVGIAIQAYLRSCGDDLAALAAWARRRGTPLWVRLVKGAYWDYEQVVAAQNGWPVPVYTGKAETDASYERHSRFLLEQRDLLRPAFASHNVRSIAHALACAEALGVRAGAFEFQMLYGMADPLKAAVYDLGQRVRVYAPYGRLLPGMAYLVRRLLENTSNTSFVRAGFLEHRSEENLLMDPALVPSSPARAGAHTGGFANHPPADFSQEEPRRVMAGLLARLRAEQAEDPAAWHHPPWYGGEAHATADVIRSLNPSRAGEVVGSSGSATRADVELCVAAAKAAFPAWRDTAVEARAALLERAAALLRRDRWRLAAIIVLECGKAWREADADVAEAIDFCAYYAAGMRQLAAPRRRDLPGEQNEYFHEGRGVAAVIAPWNFPLAILTGMAAAALVAGNTVIMKPAEQSAVIAGELQRLLVEAGFPTGVVNYLPGIGEHIGPLLVAHPDVSLVAFTGSREVGLAINQQAAEVARSGAADEVKRVITEMGGKNAIIVADDADLDEAVHGVMWSAFGYQGQKCSACSRAIVLPRVHDAFVERLVEATRSLTIGPADDPAFALGPVIDEEARERILARIAEARGEATLAYAGEVGELAGRGCYVAPHIFTGVPPGSRLAQEEIFGPVLAVLRADGLDQALAIANGTRYALTGGFYSRSPADIARVRREFRVGNLYINRKITGALVDRQPFGGFKLSGIGSKAGGPDYLLQFVVPRVITENTLRHGFVPGEGAGE